MLDKLRLHYKFKFLIKIKVSSAGLEINKIAPIFTQLGLEDASNLDDLLKEFFNIYSAQYKLSWQYREFFVILELLIWRSSNIHSTVYIRPWTTRTLILAYLAETDKITFLPFYLDENDRRLIHNKRWAVKQSKLYSLSFYTSIQLKWTPEWGYRWAVKKFSKMRRTQHSSFLTYLKHFAMLGRKINFRRKVLRKKFEDYT